MSDSVASGSLGNSQMTSTLNGCLQSVQEEELVAQPDRPVESFQLQVYLELDEEIYVYPPSR